jgi:TolB-like protein
MDKLAMDTDDIRLQLSRIVSSPPFRRAKRLAELLIYLTEETLNGRGAELQQVTIARAVYGRDKDFSAASDSLVRVEIRRLRKALVRYYQQFGEDDPWHIDLPMRSYIPVFETRDPQPERRHPQGGNENLTEDWQLPTIQIMPFNTHMLTNEQPIPLALEKTLTTDLSQFPSVRVQAYASAGANGTSANQEDSLEHLTLARQRKLDFIVTGNIWQSRRQLRIELALLDVAMGDQIWGGRFETSQEGVDLLDFPVVVSQKTASRIADAFGAVMQRASYHLRDTAPGWAPNFKAALRFFEMQMTPGQERLEACFEALVLAEPLAENSAEYFGMLGFCLIDRAVFSGVVTPESLRNARRTVRQALALDSTSTISQLSRVYLALLERDPSSIQDACERMVHSLPNSGFVHGTAGLFIAATGDYERAMAHYQRSMELVPRYPGWFHLTPCLSHYHRGEYQQALREANRIDTIDFYWEHLLKASLLAYLGRKPEADRARDSLLAAVPDFTERAEDLIQLYSLDPPLIIKIRRGLQLAGAL